MLFYLIGRYVIGECLSRVHAYQQGLARGVSAGVLVLPKSSVPQQLVLGLFSIRAHLERDID